MQETPSLYEGRIALHQLAWSSIGHPYGHDDYTRKSLPQTGN